MSLKQIGNTPYRTGKIALGCVTFGREIDETAARQVMDFALAHGITLFDTAEVYGGGASERILGEWMRNAGTREAVVLQTKTLAHRPEDVERAIAASLERLRTDRIDLYLLHRLSPETPLDETLDALGRGIRQGRIGAIGCSNCTEAELRGALEISRQRGLPRFEAQQPVYNLAAREIEAEFLPLCRAENLGVVSYSPLGAGFLSGKYTDAVPAGSRFDLVPGHTKIYFTDRNFQIVRRLAALAERVGMPMVRLAMSWALRNPDLTAVLVGARTTAHIENAFEAARAELPQEWFEEMDQFSRPALPANAD
jgi:aryl-alcohol dehydrogenase-like predicted oxidoreductase